MKGFKKRIVAMFCVAAMIVTTIPTAFPMSAEAKVLEGLSALGRQVAAEGCVLLKNENDVLPLKEDSTVSVFGRIQSHYYACGLGSGGGVNTEYRVDIVKGLEESGKVKVNSDLKKTYADWVKDHKIVEGTSWNDTPWSQEEMTVTQDVANKAKSKSDAAVVIIGRTSGENRDTAFKKGGYLLRDDEEKMLDVVSNTFDKVVVVLNVSTIIDMSWVEKYPQIDAVLYSWNGGQDGGHAVADVLTGKVNPSGKLADTIAEKPEYYPSYSNYGKDVNHYQEDIYVGYRYFETFAQDDVAYPFGYGLSYTTFETTFNRAAEKDGYINVVVSVKNTGEVAGKEVVQVYYGAPQNKLGNPVKELAAFAKTRELQPGEEQNISLNFKINDMASYDDSGVTGHESAYVLEEGKYKIYVGNDVHSSKEVYTYNQEETKVVEQLTEAAAPIEDFKRYKAVEENGKIVRKEESVPKLKVNVEEKIKKNLPEEFKKKDNNVYKLIDVYNGKVTMEEFVAQMTNEQMGMLAQGTNEVKDGYVDGCASPFGGVRAKDNEGKNLIYLSDLYGIPVATCADGPSGIKIKDKGTLLPCGNAIGCTWNIDLVQGMYELEGQEMILNKVDNLLGPGINIHRDPRCGRNFEYFSEDPILAGRMAAAIAKGVQKSGATVTAKHYAANNQECRLDESENRRLADSVVSERALREIYLKVFEIYVKEGNAQSVMTAYNPINGCWAASNYDLNTEILRNEWGFEGIVMSDWWAQTSKYAWADGKRQKGDNYLGSMIKSQNDIWMTCDNGTYKDNGEIEGRNKIKSILSDVESGYLTRAELQRGAANICTFLMKSQCFSTKYNTDFAKDVKEKFYSPGEDWFSVEQAELGNPQVTSITVDGRKVTSFNQRVLEYKVYTPTGLKELPKVEVTAEDGTTVDVQQATKENPVAVVKATEQQATVQYRIVFTDEKGLTPVLEGAVLASLSDIKVNGKSVNGFDSGVYEYSVAVDSLDKEPEVVCTTPEGVNAKVTYDTAKKVSTIQCSSMDQARSYQLRFGIAPKSDEFNETTLMDTWKIEDENKSNWALEDEHLVITTERGSTFQDENNHKNQFVQSAYGDWEVVAKLDLDKLPWTDYQSMGIVAKEDDDNYIYSKIEYSGSLEITLSQEESGTRKDLETLSESDIAKFTDTVYFKLTKMGNTYRAAVSPDGKEYIKYKTSAYGEYENPKFAIIAGTGGKDVDEELKAKFDYVQFKIGDIGDTVAIGENTKLKLAEVDPVAVSASLKPEDCKDSDGGLNLTGTNIGEYIIYNVDVEKSGYYEFTTRIASPETDTQQVSYSVYLDNKLITSFFSNGTDGAQNWVDLPGKGGKLTAGKHNLKVMFDSAGLNVNWLQFKLTKEIEDTELRTAIEAAKAKDMSAYSTEDQKAYAAAIKAAEAVLETAETKEEFDAALAELKKAEEGLTAPTIDTVKAELTVAVGAAKAVLDAGKGENTDAVWQAFVEAYNAAAEPKEDATVEELAQLKANLVAAQAALAGEDTPGSENNGTTGGAVPDAATAAAELKALVEEEKATYESDGDKYTADSWLKYVEAYIAATEADADATAEELVQLKKNLETAKAGLKEVGGTNTDTELEAAKTELKKALESFKEAYETAEDKYTDSTWKTFKSAYQEAENALNDADTTESKLKNCKDKLQKAYDKLEEKAGAVTPDSDGESGTATGNQTNGGTQGNTTTPGTATKLVDNVQVTTDKTELYAGGNTENITSVNVTVPNGATLQSVTYETTNAKVAAVDASGKITAKKKGAAIITAYVTLTNGETKAFILNIKVKKAYIDKVNVPSTVKPGKKATLKAKAYGSSKAITWKIKSGSKYAKITRKGKLTAKAKGKVKVVATSGKISKTFTIRIK